MQVTETEEGTNQEGTSIVLRLLSLPPSCAIWQRLLRTAYVKMTLPSHRYYQPPNLGGVRYRAEGRFKPPISTKNTSLPLLFSFEF